MGGVILFFTFILFHFLYVYVQCVCVYVYACVEHRCERFTCKCVPIHVKLEVDVEYLPD